MVVVKKVTDMVTALIFLDCGGVWRQGLKVVYKIIQVHKTKVCVRCSADVLGFVSQLMTGLGGRWIRCLAGYPCQPFAGLETFQHVVCWRLKFTANTTSDFVKRFSSLSKCPAGAMRKTAIPLKALLIKLRVWAAPYFLVAALITTAPGDSSN